MKKIILVGIALVIGTAAWGADKDLLTTEPERITDEAIADDIKVIQALQGRLAILNNKGVPIAGYHFAKAQAWLDFAMDEYTINDRSRVVEEALGQALGIIRQLEQGEQQISLATPIIPTSARVRADLWEKTEVMKKNADSFRCAGDKIAQLEVQLVWAGHEERELGWRHAKPFLQAAERLAREADARMADCSPPSAESAVIAATSVLSGTAAAASATAAKKAETALSGEGTVPLPATMICPDPAPVSCPEPAPVAVGKAPEPLPDRVHFALNRADLSDTSEAVIDRIAAAMKEEPRLRIMLQGHADQRGESEFNLALSRHRAENVRTRLLATGIVAERIAVAAFGKTRPIIRERNIDGYARNRRVEFVFTLEPAMPVLLQQGDLQPEKLKR